LLKPNNTTQIEVVDIKAFLSWLVGSSKQTNMLIFGNKDGHCSIIIYYE